MYSEQGMMIHYARPLGHCEVKESLTSHEESCHLGWGTIYARSSLFMSLDFALAKQPLFMDG